MIKKLYNQYVEEKAIYHKLCKEYLYSVNNSIYNQTQEQREKVNEIGKELYNTLDGKIFEIEEGRFIQVELDEDYDYEINILEQYEGEL